MENEKRKSIAANRKARHDYFIGETYEAGIELFGTEVKSIRLGGVNLKESYISCNDGQAYIVGMHISPYENGNIHNRDPLRQRRLLLHKREIRKLKAAVQQEGATIVPLSVYLTHGLVKLEIAVAKGKKLYDKRESIAARDVARHEARDHGKIRL